MCRFAAVLALAACASALATADGFCHLGPSFWCENPGNARTCNAVSYCKAFVWKAESQSPENGISAQNSLSDTCQDCKKFIASLKSFLANESVTFAGDVIISHLCRLVEPYRKECEASVREFLPSVASTLVPLLDPVNTCKQIKLCLKQEWNLDMNFEQTESINWSKILPAQDNEPNLDVCVDCSKFMTGLKTLSTQFQPLVKDLVLNNICSNMRGVAKTECTMIAKMILPQIVGTIAKQIDPRKICSSIGMCPKMENLGDSNIREDNLWFLKAKSSLSLEDLAAAEWDILEETKTCKDCKNFFVALVRFLQDETTILIQDVILDQVCSRTGPFKQQCQAIINNFFQSTIKILLNMINPQKSCSAVRACPRKLENQDKELSDFHLQLDSIDFEKMLLLLDHPKVLNRTKCDTCKETIKFIQEIFADKSLRDTIQMVLGQFVCSLLGPVGVPCKIVVKTVIPLVFDALARLLKNPDKICRAFRICAVLRAETVDVTFDSIEDGTDLYGAQSEFGDDCLICQKVAQNFENFLKLGVDSIVSENDHQVFCQNFSEQEKAKCASMVKKFNPTLINRLSAVIAPKFFCQKFHLCSSAGDKTTQL